ncbi:MAG TPA: MmgE/PrpD family protein [Micropepsaceae bacterium]|nr:MmgE/PrpD family protein [Micropepsaceae bacterium]
MTISEQIASFAADIRPIDLPAAVRDTVRNLLVDVAGLCLAARNSDYVKACVASAVSEGRATAIGHDGGFGPYDAALINGTAAHGEDYDDTFEGGPVHAGAVIVPAVLAAAEHRGLAGDRVLAGIAAGAEIMCRMSLVAPQATHKACFHPTAVFGAPAAAVGVSVALGLPPAQIANAIAISGSLASGIIEYLADGSWTKRLHAGQAAQSGLRAVFLAESGFIGPKTVLEGQHGFYKAFAPSKTPDFSRLVDGLGREWVMAALAFKPYACGTMTQPYIDCAIELAHSGVRAGDIETMICEVGEGTVHRLWEPLRVKQSPPNGYAAKFSTPYCMAAGFIDGKAGFEQFTDQRVADPHLRKLAGKISYVIDPDNPYPANFTGHIRAVLEDGSVREVRRGHMRGGAHEPLAAAEISAKFNDNARFGGWSAERAGGLAAALDAIVRGDTVNLAPARGN